MSLRPAACPKAHDGSSGDDDGLDADDPCGSRCSADPAFAPDGINLLPLLRENTAPAPRKVFWRYKTNAQRAMRDGDYKYLKILDARFSSTSSDRWSAPT